MAPRIAQHFGIGGVIGILNRDDGAAQLRVFVPQVARELLLGLSRSDHQNFMHAFERLRDFIKELAIGGRLVAAMGTLSAVYALMLIVRMDHGIRLFRRCELPSGCLLMIDPNDGVIM